MKRFWDKVDKRGPDECWEWKAGKDKDGYGKIRFDGKHQRAHRVALALSGVAVHDGMLALHRCDTPSCVNPSHLFAGTHQENVDDKLAKGRCPIGEKNHNAKLTNEQAKYVRHLYFAERHTTVALADFFRVSTYAINQIVRGLRYKPSACMAA